MLPLEQPQLLPSSATSFFLPSPFLTFYSGQNIKILDSDDLCQSELFFYINSGFSRCFIHLPFNKCFEFP